MQCPWKCWKVEQESRGELGRAGKNWGELGRAGKSWGEQVLGRVGKTWGELGRGQTVEALLSVQREIGW